MQSSDNIDDARADALLMGLDPALFALDDDGDGIWAQNLPVVTAFLSVSTQWRVLAQADGSLRYVGMDYAGVRAGLRQAGLRLTPADWSDLQIVEAGALGALNRARPA